MHILIIGISLLAILFYSEQVIGLLFHVHVHYRAMFTSGWCRVIFNVSNNYALYFIVINSLPNTNAITGNNQPAVLNKLLNPSDWHRRWGNNKETCVKCVYTEIVSADTWHCIGQTQQFSNIRVYISLHIRFVIINFYFVT